MVNVHFSSLFFPIHNRSLFSQPKPRFLELVLDDPSFCLPACHKQQGQSSSLASSSFRRVVGSVFGCSLTAPRSSQDKITTKPRRYRLQEVNISASCLSWPASQLQCLKDGGILPTYVYFADHRNLHIE